jgi:hypothetical protein
MLVVHLEQESIRRKSPSGHFVVARPLNLRVTALILAAFTTRRWSVPLNIAVLPLAMSFCSKPCKNKAGSARFIETFTPLPETSGLSAGSVPGMMVFICCARAAASVACLTSSVKEFLEIIPLTGPPIDPRIFALIFSKKGDLFPPFVVVLPKLYANGSEASEGLRVDAGRVETTERIRRFARVVEVESVLSRR